MFLMFIPDVFESLGEIYFVVQVMVFSYMLFFFYITFRDTQALFGLSSLIAGYFIFLHGISVTILASTLIIFVMFGMQIQQAIQFGLAPLLGYQHMGDRFVKIGDEQAMQGQQQMQQYQELMNKAQRGEASPEEIAWLEQQASNQDFQQNMNSSRQRALMMQQQQMMG